MLPITETLAVPLAEIELKAVRAQGAGGQNVNKTSTAVHLRFDARASSLPEDVRTRLLGLRDQRVGADGVIVIKAQRFRSQEQNRSDALERLAELLRRAAIAPRVRKATKVSRAAKRRRVDEKVRRGRTKALRGKAGEE